MAAALGSSVVGLGGKIGVVCCWCVLARLVSTKRDGSRVGATAALACSRDGCYESKGGGGTAVRFGSSCVMRRWWCGCLPCKPGKLHVVLAVSAQRPAASCNGQPTAADYSVCCGLRWACVGARLGHVGPINACRCPLLRLQGINCCPLPSASHAVDAD